MKSIKDIEQAAEAFAQERDWNQFHSPKNLSMALSVEVSELMEHFQWLDEQESNNLSPEKKQHVSDEIADVQVYLVRLASKLGIDILQAVDDKMKKNAQKYPVELSKGKADKYTQYLNKKTDGETG